MTKNDLIIRFSEIAGIEPEDASIYVETFMELVMDTLGRGERIEIRDFGVFQIKERSPREARNPRTGIAVNVDKKRTVKFKAGKALLERIREAGFQELKQNTGAL